MEHTVLLPPSVMTAKKRKRRRAKPTITELVYIDLAKQEEEVFGPFELRFLSSDERSQLQAELRLIYDRMDAPSLADFQRTQVVPYLAQYYGSMLARDVPRFTEDW
jgi:hypothetical protein